MSTELATTEPNAAAVLPATDPSDAAMDRMLKQARMMQAANQIGKALAATSMVPQHFQGKPDDATAAIMHGNELGLPAIQSLQQIFVVRGKPAMYARALVAIVIAKGHRIFEVEASADSVTWAGERADNGDTMTSTWTIERATKAGFTSNKLYESQPVEMLRAKAQSEVARNLFPDILLGMSAREDLDLQQPDAPRRVASAVSVDELKARLSAPKQPEVAAAAQATAASAESAANAAASSETAAPKPTTVQNRTLSALFDRAGLAKDNKAGRRIVFASFFPDRELGAAPSADETEHVIGELEKIATSGEGDDVLVAYAEDVITSHDQAAQS